MIRVLNREILRLGGITVTVEAGVAWITRRGELRDWVLEAGRCATLVGKDWLVQNLSREEELRLRLEPMTGPAPFMPHRPAVCAAAASPVGTCP